MIGAADLGRALAPWLTPRAALACLGASAVPAIARVTRPAPAAPPPAAAPIWLWCAGQPVPRAPLERALGGPAVAAAEHLGLVELTATLATPRLRLAPVGLGLVVCDRPGLEPDRVPWPDDSSLHLVGALGGARPDRWLDVGTGPATAPLALGRRGTAVRATDRAPRALALARLGLALAGRDDVAVAEVDGVATADGPWDLITLNAPIPRERADGAPATAWHVADDGAALLATLWARAAGLVTPTGVVVVHAVDADDDRYGPPAALGGALTVARYTPVDAPAFAIYRWRPHAPASRRRGAVALGPGHPFVTAADLDAIAAADDRAGSDLR